MTADQPFAIAIEHMGFRYPDNAAVSFADLNLKVEKGIRFGLFGPNGAGKTTLMNLMTGVLSANEGSIKLLGKETGKQNKEVNTLFGFVPQDFSFYQELSPAENLEFFGAWAGLTQTEINNRTDELLHILGLEDVRNKPVEKFSGGMKRRVNLAIGVIHNPQVLFLDEPTVGVDPVLRQQLWGIFADIAASGVSIIVSSHVMDDASRCDELLLIRDGELLAQGSPRELCERTDTKTVEGSFLKLVGEQS